MRGLNKVMLIGNIGVEPELKQTESFTVCNLSLATSESWKDKNTSEQKERTEWHRISLFGKLAEIAGQYLKKGSRVYIEGKLQTRKWQDQQGNDRYTTEIIANNLLMLDSSNSGSQASPKQTQPQEQQVQQQFDDDIPF